MTYQFPPPVPSWISIGGFLLLVLVGIVSLAAAFVPLRNLRHFRTIRIRRRWLVALALVLVAAITAAASTEMRGRIAGILLYLDGIVATLAVTRVCLLPFGRKLTVASGCAGLLLAHILAFIFFVVPTVNLARESGRRDQPCRTQLRHLGIALHNYAASNDGAYPDSVSGDEGEPQWSWRIGLLPFVDYKFLLASYSRDGNWDAPANLPVGRTRVYSYTCPANPVLTDDSGRFFAAFAAVTGPLTIFPDRKGIRLADVTDGASYTILVGECSGLNIVWTEPRDIDVSKQKNGINLPGDRPRTSSSILSSYHRGGAYVVFADGRVRFLSEKIDPKVLQALTTATGGENVPDEGS